MTATRAEIGVAGAIGGASPKILNLAMYLTGDQSAYAPVNWFGYVVGVLLWAALGCGVALIWKERIPQRAFYLGIGLPAILQVALNNPLQTPAAKAGAESPPAATHTIFSVFSSSAFAQEPRVSSTSTRVTATTAGMMAPPRKTITITFNRVPTDAVLVFSDEDKTIEEVRPDWVKAALAGKIDILVPAGAKELEVLSSYSRNAPDENLRLSGSNMSRFQTLHLETKTDFLAGFLKALGRKDADAMTLSPSKAPSPN